MPCHWTWLHAHKFCFTSAHSQELRNPDALTAWCSDCGSSAGSGGDGRRCFCCWRRIRSHGCQVANRTGSRTSLIVMQLLLRLECFNRSLLLGWRQRCGRAGSTAICQCSACAWSGSVGQCGGRGRGLASSCVLRGVHGCCAWPGSWKQHRCTTECVDCASTERQSCDGVAFLLLAQALRLDSNLPRMERSGCAECRA